MAYAYDAANRLTTVTDWNSKATSYAYDDAGRMTTTTLPASTGVVSSYTYDNADRLTAISHVKGGVTLASATYTLDNAGNRTQKVDLNGTESYSYDNAYRLTSVTYPGPSTTSYTYDAFGNRSTKVDAGGTTNYAYNDDSRLTSVTPPNPAPVVNYTWDNNGNVTARGSDSFAWDFEDRMMLTATPNAWPPWRGCLRPAAATSATVGGTTTTFAYRGDGLRNSRTTGGVTTTFTWDIASGLPVVLDDGSQYVYGAGLVSQIAGANTYYYLSDGLGSTIKTVDNSGAVVNAYTYDVYGKTTSSSGAQSNEFQFAGQQTDATGLQYLRARYYDPETGGFLSRDDVNVLPHWIGNPYGYAGGNPCGNTDPSGNSWVPEGPKGGKKDCNQVYDKIVRLVGIMLQKIRDYRDDPQKLPETGRNSRASHREAYEDGYKRGINNRLRDFDDSGCGPKGPLGEWFLKTARWLGEYEHRLDNLDDWYKISNDDHWWDNLPKPHWPELPEVPDDIWWNDPGKWPIPLPVPGPVPA